MIKCIIIVITYYVLLINYIIFKRKMLNLIMNYNIIKLINIYIALRYLKKRKILMQII